VIDELKMSSMLSTLKCKHVHEREIFIANDMRLWPCCFLRDSAFKNQDDILNKLDMYGPEWNDLSTKSIDDVLDHPWFSKVLSASWDPRHPQHLTRCLKTCAHNKAYQNEMRYQ